LIKGVQFFLRRRKCVYDFCARWHGFPPKIR
jgi:hypothetical protein